MIFDFVLHPLTMALTMVRNLLHLRALTPPMALRDHELFEKKANRHPYTFGIVVSVGPVSRPFVRKRLDPRMGPQHGTRFGRVYGLLWNPIR